MITKDTQQKLADALQILSVSENARKVFILLLEQGPMRASSAAKQSGVRRELTYRALEELEKKELILKNEPLHGVALFQVIHPEIILKKLKESVAHEEAIQHVLQNSMSILVSVYNKGVGLPHVNFKQGIEGLAQVYNEIHEIGQDTKLIRSPMDVRSPELDALVDDYRSRLIKNKIHTKMVTSFTRHTLEELKERDRKHLINRRLLPQNTLNIPAQIIIYGEKVAITSFETPMVTTIIEDTAINSTFNLIFEILWNLGKPIF